MPHQTPLLIVFTDELKSTSQDLSWFKKLYKNANQKYKEKIAARRVDLFKVQLDNLSLRGDGGKWTVIKTVGDSLIISLNATSEDKLREIVDDCLGSLFYIWQHSPQKIRIACHLTNNAEIVTGDDLSEIKKCFEVKRDNLVLDPVLNSIDADIFGPAMNKAARLASIPRSSLFVVSRELMEFMRGKKNINDRIIKNESSDLKFKSQDGPVNIRAYPIPIINLKGFESGVDKVPGRKLKKYSIPKKDEEKLRSYLLPWYIWEIEQADSEIKVAEDSLPLRVQFKELQSLKIVTGKFRGTNPEFINTARDIFEDKRLKVNPCKLFVDCVFNVKKTYSYYPPNPFRIFNGNGKNTMYKWEDAHAKFLKNQNRLALQYLYVMFTSVPDTKTNGLLRKYFTPKAKEWQFQHISYDVYESMIFSNDAKFTGGDQSYYLLLFQIKEENIDEADDWHLFFEGNRYLLNKYLDCHCDSYGLLSGEFDGFVLFRARGDKFKDLRNEIEEGMRNSVSFFFKIAPIFLFDLNLSYVSEKNIDYLRAVRKKYDLLNK